MDRIADMLTIIRNAGLVNHKSANVPKSKEKEAILDVLKREGYIVDYKTILNEDNNPINFMQIDLKYCDKIHVITELKRISKPGCRVYTNVSDLRRQLHPGIFIISTPKGMKSNFEALEGNLGGEVICRVF